MNFTHGIAAAGPAYGERCHVEVPVTATAVFSESEQGIPCFAVEMLKVHQLLFNPLNREGIMSCGHRCVRREHGAGSNDLLCLSERTARFQQFANPFEDNERGVAFIEVPHC